MSPSRHSTPGLRASCHFCHLESTDNSYFHGLHGSGSIAPHRPPWPTFARTVNLLPGSSCCRSTATLLVARATCPAARVSGLALHVSTSLKQRAAPFSEAYALRSLSCFSSLHVAVKTTSTLRRLLDAAAAYGWVISPRVRAGRLCRHVHWNVNCAGCMRMDMCMDTCAAMCVDMSTDSPVQNACARVYGQVYRFLLRHVYRHVCRHATRHRVTAQAQAGRCRGRHDSRARPHLAGSPRHLTASSLRVHSC